MMAKHKKYAFVLMTVITMAGMMMMTNSQMNQLSGLMMTMMVRVTIVMEGMETVIQMTVIMMVMKTLLTQNMIRMDLSF